MAKAECRNIVVFSKDMITSDGDTFFTQSFHAKHEVVDKFIRHRGPFLGQCHLQLLNISGWMLTRCKESS